MRRKAVLSKHTPQRDYGRPSTRQRYVNNFPVKETRPQPNISMLYLSISIKKPRYKRRWSLSRLFWTFRKKLKAKKTQAEKNSSKFSQNSSKSIKNSIICQLKTDFLLKKVLKLIYFAQKFAQT